MDNLPISTSEAEKVYNAEGELLGADLISDSISNARQDLMGIMLAALEKYGLDDITFSKHLLNQFFGILEAMDNLEQTLVDEEYTEGDRRDMSEDEEGNKLSRVTDTFTNPFKVKS